MKKLLLCTTLILALFLVGCNNNKSNNADNNNNNIIQNQEQNQGQNQGQNQEVKDDTPVVVYDNPDFSEKAGFKVSLGDSLKGVTYDSIFLTNNATAQLDLKFPDGSIGTMLVDSMNTSHLFKPDDAVFVGDIKVSIETGADGIMVYEWEKDNYTFVFSTTAALKDSQKLKDLVNDLAVEQTNK